MSKSGDISLSSPEYDVLMAFEESMRAHEDLTPYGLVDADGLSVVDFPAYVGKSATAGAFPSLQNALMTTLEHSAHQNGWLFTEHDMLNWRDEPDWWTRQHDHDNASLQFRNEIYMGIETLVGVASKAPRVYIDTYSERPEKRELEIILRNSTRTIILFAGLYNTASQQLESIYAARQIEGDTSDAWSQQDTLTICQ